MSDSSTSTRNPSADDDRVDWLETLKRLVIQVTPLARRQFARDLSHELSQAATGGVWFDDGFRYLVVESAEMHDLPLWRDISIECRLVDEPVPDGDVDVVELSSRPMSEEPIRYVVHLHPGEVKGGEQYYHFTFRSSVPIRENMTRFKGFLENSYISPEDMQREFRRRRLEMIEAHNTAKRAKNNESQA